MRCFFFPHPTGLWSVSRQRARLGHHREVASRSPAEADTLLDWCEEAAMYDICITKIGVVPMTRRSDIIKILVIAALLGVLFYYLAHYGLSVPQSI
jgi:hypothetical protein